MQKHQASEKHARRFEEQKVSKEEAARKEADLLAYKKRLKAQKAARFAEAKK